MPTRAALTECALHTCSILDVPEATLAQLDLQNAAYGDFRPAFYAMDDGFDRPGGCWNLFEVRPSFDPVSLEWQSEGDSWEVGLDPSENLYDTPEFQRWVKSGFSLIRIVEVADIEPRYHPLAMMDKDARSLINTAPVPPAGWCPCSSKLLDSGGDCGVEPRWSSGPIGQHWHPPVSEVFKQTGEAQ